MALEIQRMSDSGAGGGSNGNPVGPPGQPPQPPPPYGSPPAPYTPPPPSYPGQQPQYGAPQQTPYPQPPQPPQQTPYPQPPQQAPYQPPPAYPQQPPGGYGAPTYAPPAPQQQGYQQPMQPGFAPPPAKKSRTMLYGGIAAAVLIVLLAAGGFIANSSLSSTYSAGKAVQSYFAAEARGDVGYMVANANYLKGDNGTDSLFSKAAVTAMANDKENKSISGVTVTSTDQLDSSTAKVTVSMSWNSNQVTESYTVHKDTSRTHFIFYNDWKLDIPASTVSMTLPNQAGAVQVDGIDVPSSSSSVSVIQGYHTVTMQATDFYDADNETVNALDSTASVTFKSGLSSSAMANAAASIKAAFNNVTCDAGKYIDCPGHVYKVPSGYYYTLQLPGGNVNAYSTWVWSFTGDPTSGMKLTVSSTTGQVNGTGTCAMKMVVDGKTTVNFTGTWDGSLTWSNGAFDSSINLNCDTSRA